MFGFGIGALSGALSQLDARFSLSSAALGAVPALQAVGLMLGSAAGGRLADTLGRRRAIAASDVAVALASAALAAAPSMALVYGGQLLAGFGCGLGSASNVA